MYFVSHITKLVPLLVKNSILSYYLTRPITTFCQNTQEQDNIDWIRTRVEMSHIYDLFINACNEYNDKDDFLYT